MTKITWVGAVLMLLVGWCSLASGAAAVVPALDLAKIGGKEQLRFLENAIWPDDRILATKGKAATKEQVAELQAGLAIALKPQYLPDDQTLEGRSLYVEKLRGDRDYLLLSYDRLQHHIEVQARKGYVFVVVRPAQPEPPDPPESIRAYVVARLHEHTQLPVPGRTDTPPGIAITPADIGGSQCGTIIYGPGGPPAVNWWSDGNAVMFAIPVGLMRRIQDIERRVGAMPRATRPVLPKDAKKD